MSGNKEKAKSKDGQREEKFIVYTAGQASD